MFTHMVMSERPYKCDVFHKSCVDKDDKCYKQGFFSVQFYTKVQF